MASIARGALDRLTKYQALVKISEEMVIEHNLNSQRLAGLLERVLDFDLALFSVNDLDPSVKSSTCCKKRKVVFSGIAIGCQVSKVSQYPPHRQPARLPISLKLLRDRGIQSYFSVPLITAHWSVGAMGTWTERAHAYTQQDVEFLRPVAAQVEFAVNEDLTYRRLEVSEPNRQEEEGLWSLLERSQTTQFSLDLNYLVLTGNTGAHRLAGYSFGDVVGHTLEEFFPREYLTQVKKDLRVAAAEGRNDVERWFVRRDDSRIWVNRMITALRHPWASLSFLTM